MNKNHVSCVSDVEPPPDLPEGRGKTTGSQGVRRVPSPFGGG